MRVNLRAKNILSACVTLPTVAIVMTALIAGCAKTVAEKPAMVEQVENGQASAANGFFGDKLSLLKPGKEGEAAMLYIDPAVDWKQYNKIMLEPVEFWDSANSTVSPADQHMLTAYFYNKIKETLQKNFTLVDQGGPGVMVLQVALVNASSATPGLRSVSVAIPQLRIINSVQSLATGSYAFVGSAEVEMKATDAVTGQFLAGGIDQRAGGIAISAAAQWKWGDAENAMDYWAQRVNDRLLKAQGREPAAS